MKYMGSKNRHAKELLPIILKNRRTDQWYIEPFVSILFVCLLLATLWAVLDAVSDNPQLPELRKELLNND